MYHCNVLKSIRVFRIRTLSSDFKQQLIWPTILDIWVRSKSLYEKHIILIYDLWSKILIFDLHMEILFLDTLVTFESTAYLMKYMWILLWITFNIHQNYWCFFINRWNSLSEACQTQFWWFFRQQSWIN